MLLCGSKKVHIQIEQKMFRPYGKIANNHFEYFPTFG